MAFGGQRSLTSSAVTAIGRPFSAADVLLVGWLGAVPGIAADCMLSARDWSMPFTKGFTSDDTVSFESDCATLPAKLIQNYLFTKIKDGKKIKHSIGIDYYTPLNKSKATS